MATINVDDFDGLRNLTPGSGDKKLATILQDIADDLETVRANGAALHAKLDADVGVTDTDYAATLDIATTAVKTKKGRT